MIEGENYAFLARGERCVFCMPCVNFNWMVRGRRHCRTVSQAQGGPLSPSPLKATSKSRLQVFVFGDLTGGACFDCAAFLIDAGIHGTGTGIGWRLDRSMGIGLDDRPNNERSPTRLLERQPTSENAGPSWKREHRIFVRQLFLRVLVKSGYKVTPHIATEAWCSPLSAPIFAW